MTELIDVNRHHNDGSYAYYTTKLRLASMAQRLFYIHRKLLAADTLQDLQFRKGMNIDEIKVYFLFLDAYFDPLLRASTHRDPFFSKNKVALEIAKRTREIEQWKHVKFLSKNHNHIMQLLKTLIERRQLIYFQDRKLEMEIYPGLFKQEKRQKKQTWNRMTLQPVKAKIINGMSFTIDETAYEDKEYRTLSIHRPTILHSRLYAHPSLAGPEFEAEPRLIREILQEILLGGLSAVPQSSELKKRLDKLHNSIFDNSVLVKDLQYECMKWLNALGLDDEMSGDFLLLKEDYETKQYMERYNELQKLIIEPKKSSQSHFSSDEMLKLLIKDQETWWNKNSKQAVGGRKHANKK